MTASKPHHKEIVDRETGEVTRKNTNFVMFFDDNLPLLNQMIKENPTAARIFMWIVNNMDGFGALVTSQVAISHSLSVHRNTVGNCISYLKNKKALTVIKSGSTNIYAINEQIAWRQTADNKKFAHFSAKVYVVPEEQEADYQTSMFNFVHENKKINNKNNKIKTSKPSEFSKI